MQEEGTGAGDGFFAALDAASGGAVTAAGIPGEHDHDRAEQALVDAAAARGDAAALAAAFTRFAAEHEAHLKHEEDVMMPLTMKIGAMPEERGRKANKSLLRPMLPEFEAFHLKWILQKLLKHKPAEATRVFICGLQVTSTPAEYVRFLPTIAAEVPAPVFAAMDAEFGIAGPGTVAP